MDKLFSWRRWSWDEIYTSLTREQALGEAFEVERRLIADPAECGADRAARGTLGWDYCFRSADGPSLYVQDLGDRYAAYLEEEGPRLPGGWSESDAPMAMGPAMAAAWGGFAVFLGSLWMVLQATFTRVG